MLGYFEVLRSQVVKDITVWLRRPSVILATMSAPLAYLFVVFFVSITIGHNRVALVVDGTGPEAARMATIVQNSDAFITRRMTSGQAAAALAHLDVAAILTIPSTFDASILAHRAAPVVMTLNNVNADEADDLRRSLPAAVEHYYSSSARNPMRIDVAEHDIHAEDFTLGQFEFIPVLMFMVMVNGVVSSGFMTCQEWEQGTITELLLAPVGRWALVIAKVLSGWTTTLLLASVLIGVGALEGLVRLPARAVFPCLLIVLLVALASTCFGNVLGIIFKYIGKVQAIGIETAIDMFFLTGGFSVLAFLPDPVQTIARVMPTHYAVDALDRQILYNSSRDLVLDVAVLVVVTAVLLVVNVRIFRRRVL